MELERRNLKMMTVKRHVKIKIGLHSDVAQMVSLQKHLLMTHVVLYQMDVVQMVSHQKLQDKNVQKNVKPHNSNVVKTLMKLKKMLTELTVHQDLFPLLTQSKFVKTHNHQQIVKIPTSDVVLME